MTKILDRRSFLRIAGVSMGAAALYQFAPKLAFGQAVSNSMRDANGEAPTPFRRLTIAADTGSAILGPARADIFFGGGDAAGARAGAIRHPADFVVLLPTDDKA